MKLKTYLVSGNYGILPKSKDYFSAGLPLIRGKDIRGMSLNVDDLVKVPFTYYDEKYQVDEGDLLILVKGATIDSSDGVLLVQEDLGKVIYNGSVFRIKVKDINKHFVYVFMTTKFFTYQKLLGVANNGIEYNSLETIKNYLIPNLSSAFQTRIEFLVKAAHEKLEQSKALYAEAESLLLEELGLRDFEPSNENVAVKSFKESFAASGRLDAEFYQPKYDYALEKLKELKPLSIVSLESLLTTLTNGHTPLRHDLSVGEVAFLTAEHIHDFRVNFDSDKRITTEHHNGEVSRTKIETGDLLLTIKGRIGNAAVVENVPRPANINQDVALLRLNDDINAYYIAGFLNSILGKMFVNRIATGQINPFLGLGNLRTIPIPLFAPERMNEIGEHLKNKIHQAFDTQQQSKYLLETAKRGVELAIEQDEQAALEEISKCKF